MTSQTTPAMCSRTDRISRLPDDVLHNILSLLPNTEARARTSLLSKRFLHLWAHHPSVLIGDPEILRFLRPSDSDTAAIVGRYQISVDLCLASLLCPVLQTLELNLFSSRRSFRWIRSAAGRRVRDLRLSAAPSLHLKLPVSIFYCTSLVSLDLYCCQLPSIRPKFDGFPSLTHLKITGTGDHESLASLLSKCPSLQSLKLECCYDLTTLDLSSQTLTDVELLSCPGLHRVRIDAPNLARFSYCGNVNNIYLENARRLLDVNLSHFYSGTGVDFATPVQWARPVRSLSHVSQRLRVNEWFFRFLLPETTPEPLFGNLKMLHCVVDWVTSSMLNSLAAVLGHCRNLEQLKIDLSCGVRRSVVCFKLLLAQLNMTEEESGTSPDCMDKFEQALKDDSEQEVWDPSELPADVTPSLKTIIVNCFVGTPNEMKMLEYLVGRSSVLEKISIGDLMMREREEIHRLIAYIPRASSHVQICEFNMLS
ncbi:FBD-associated F-box protein-like isoform X1 [Iris pallida]|uniref:FBD-associated F-box protein-like isoform X1 n=1 Tax=Iris pallida TaxID=29817 RepID=A0AAX6FZ04_IRIPA|nr:FBD-associated F-box protein-like isoform X1 [Iris pallida]